MIKVFETKKDVSSEIVGIPIQSTALQYGLILTTRLKRRWLIKRTTKWLHGLKSIWHEEEEGSLRMTRDRSSI